MASKPSQPKGIGGTLTSSSSAAVTARASKPSQPKGIGDGHRPCTIRCWLRRHQSHLSRKALETALRSHGFRLQCSGHQSHLSRKALETVSPSMVGSSGESKGIKAISAERHWRLRQAAEVSLSPQSASKPSQPKGIGDLAPVRRVSFAFRRHQSHLSRKALETG